MRPYDVKSVQAVVGGDHGDTAFQFGVAITAEMHDGRKIYFKVTTVKLICRKDKSKLLEATILQRLTDGLKIISTQPLHLYFNSNNKDLFVCSFNTPPPDSQDHTTIEITVFVTGDLARTINPTENDVIAYQKFVDATVSGHVLRRTSC